MSFGVIDMKKISIIVVNYCGSQLTKNCYESIVQKESNLNIEFIVVDNFSTLIERERLKELFVETKVRIIFLNKNYGYFRALNVGLIYAKEKLKDNDLYIIGNNDLEFDSDFFKELRDVARYDSNVLVISPNITNLKGIKQNPHSIDGIGRFREIIYDVYYSNYFMAQLIGVAARSVRWFSRRSDYKHHDKSGSVKLGFGACYIIKAEFFNNFEALWAPVFLMGEELMFSRQLETRGFRIFYERNLNVRHLDNATISKTPSKLIWVAASMSHKIYRSFISPWRRQMDAPITQEWIDECRGQLDYARASNRLCQAHLVIETVRKSEI